jgi:prophage maintenance system killer protein
MHLTSEQIKRKLHNINLRFSDGTVRYDACLEDLSDKTVLQVAWIVAEQHPFTDGNKRTAIKFCELMFDEKVPDFVYTILERA